MQASDDAGPGLAWARAAELTVQARLKDFEAAALIGSHSELERAAAAVESATTTMLAHKRVCAEALLRSWGLDPETRPQ